MNQRLRSYLILIVFFILIAYPVLWLSNLAYELFLDSRSYNKGGEIISRVRHLGVIMDGNRRWAAVRGYDVSYGYEVGLEKFWDIVQLCIEEHVRHLSVYALSVDNLERRNSEELEKIYALVQGFLQPARKEWVLSHGVRIHIIGDMSLLSSKIQEAVQSIEEETKEGEALHVYILLAYDPIEDITYGVKSLAQDVHEGRLAPSLIDNNRVLRALRSGRVPPIDLLVRTGAHERLSGFLPVQSIYSELVFLPCMWPEITKSEIRKLIHNFFIRTRNFGA